MDRFGKFTAEHRERAGGAAVIMQLGSLAGKPADQPEIHPVVAVEPLVPAFSRVVLHVRVPARSHLVSDKPGVFQ
jgi:hypothetical protein